MKRNVLITGANRGIGLGIANEFLKSRELYNIISTTRNKGELANLKRDGFTPVFLDVSSQTSIDEAEAQLKELNLLPDIIINNAGIANTKLFMQISEKDVEEIFNVNFYGTFRVIRKFIKNMSKNKFGRIINISSVLAGMPQKGFSHYCASKAAIESMTRVISLEYASKGITANCIAPGFVETEILDCLGEEGANMIENKIPVKSISTPADIGAISVFLASEAARHITGETININGGLYFR
ncbi:SDR family NAD(P)-dependent oxidoreductase [Serratia marcescens]|uniref:3-oxoacyl-[acyl-carrier-protein] reductase FabG n=2 Tax=Serratia marcescens TaxID=615 RepID=A0A1C3HNG5_SERMA|nr:SDR family NAD(P)-dependent oxidoreductase [Serratia marcescens]SAY46572.1 3-oxoacyl-[acyl-carrier-protein] reductase FabG [Serratia marcescens]